jgi:hypothetical protein
MAVRMDRPSATPRPAREMGRAGAVAAGAGGSRRRARLSEVALGVVVIAVCALGVVLWQRSTTSTEAVLVLGRSVRAGEELRADALRVEDVHVGALVGHVAAADSRRIVGKTATADLPAGTLVTDALFVGRPPVPAGSTVVAAALVPGQFATFELRPGQAVTAIRTGGATATAQPDAGAVLAAATVYEVRALDDTSGTVVVSLLVPEATAPAVASAAAAKSLSLALVGTAP